MPFWLTWLFGIIGKHFLRILMYGAIILGIGFFLYSAFLKPTNTTNVASGGKIYNIYEQPKQRLASFGCANLEIEAAWKKSQAAKSLNIPTPLNPKKLYGKN